MLIIFVVSCECLCKHKRIDENNNNKQKNKQTKTAFHIETISQVLRVELYKKKGEYFTNCFTNQSKCIFLVLPLLDSSKFEAVLLCPTLGS